MKLVSIIEARNKLSELIRCASSGEDVLLTVHNHPVARIVSLSPTIPATAQNAAPAQKRPQEHWIPNPNSPTGWVDDDGHPCDPPRFD